MSQAPTIMAVGAHHDDNELIAGTLARHRQAGWRVVSVVVTDGRTIDGAASSDHVRIRENESRQAAALLEMQCEFLRVPEGMAEPTSQNRSALVRLLRRYRPSIVITHPPHDYHLDHMWVSRCTLEAAHLCWNGAVEPDVELCAPPLLYYGDAWFVPFEPDEYVDISQQMDLKLRMLACHRSQLPPGKSGDEGGMLELARLQSRYRGVEAGVQFAEAFRRAPGIGSVRKSSLLGQFPDGNRP